MPTNVNFLSPIEFKLILDRLPNVEFFIQSANIPGIASGVTERATPFKALFEPGDKLSYDDFNVSIVCDEDMVSYREISDWLVSITKPESYDQYKAAASTKTGLKTDGTLIILNSNKNGNVSIKFKDLFPVSVGSMQLNTTGTDVTPPTFEIVFKYTSYDIVV